MKRLFIDTNKFLDLILRREPFYPSANELFDLATSKAVELFVSTLTFATATYIMRKNEPAIVRAVLRGMRAVVTVVPLRDHHLELALQRDSPFLDIEDALQYASALTANCEAIITRDLDDFAPSILPVMTAAAFVDGWAG